MTTRLLAPRIPRSAGQAWELELDAELTPRSPALTVERAAAVASLLSHIHGVERVTVRPHCGGRFVRAMLTVDAHDFTDAVDRAAAFLRSSAAAAGVGPLILVAARHQVAPTP